MAGNHRIIAQEAKRKAMKKSILSIAISLAALLAVTSANAQTTWMRVQVPFQFLAGDKLLPAGEYEVEYDPASYRMTVRSFSNSAGMFLSVGRTELARPAEDKGTLVFYKYGSHYVLRRAWLPDRTQGFELPKSNRERELAKVTVKVELASVRVSSK